MVTKGKRIKQLRKYINKEWSTYYFKFIQDNPMQNWAWSCISCNPFTKEKEAFINRKYREHMASYKIQQWCLSIIVSPHYKIGRTMIDKKYKELFA